CVDATVCVECRTDLDCDDRSTYCLSGSCTPCTADRRCGPQCLSCGGDMPYCKNDGAAASAKCVRCRDDKDCKVGRCDPTMNECVNQCPMTCSAGTFCDTTQCVECYADTQCCGTFICDPQSSKCTPACHDSSDC